MRWVALLLLVSGACGAATPPPVASPAAPPLPAAPPPSAPHQLRIAAWSLAGLDPQTARFDEIARGMERFDVVALLGLERADAMFDLFAQLSGWKASFVDRAGCGQGVCGFYVVFYRADRAQAVGHPRVALELRDVFPQVPYDQCFTAERLDFCLLVFAAPSPGAREVRPRLSARVAARRAESGTQEWVVLGPATDPAAWTVIRTDGVTPGPPPAPGSAGSPAPAGGSSP